MPEPIEVLKARISRIARISQANALLEWDQQTYMPPGAAAARAEQVAALSELVHELSTNDEMGASLAGSERCLNGADPDGDDARMLRVTRRNFDRMTKVPSTLAAELARQGALAHDVWVRARAANDFALFAPNLERMFELTRQMARHLGYAEHIYDALADLYETGARHSQISAMFEDMKPRLVDLVRGIAASKLPVDDAPIHGDFPIERQRQVTIELVKQLGYDLTRGRQDEAPHPFCSSFSRDDVRIATRFDATCLTNGLYASLHEAGHAMYEQGSPERFEGTSLAGGTSLGVHESQSRLWENLVGRSREFARYVFPQLKAAFPAALATTDSENLYRAVNAVRPSLIRVEADEVTYNLHVLLRFELESDLLTGDLAVRDLPDAWNAKMKAYLGMTPPTDSDGCLQDVHWSGGLIGYFPTYTIGTLLSGQLWNATLKAIPDVYERIERGEFGPLLGWLRENVHQYGCKFDPAELVVKATGEPLTSRYYVEYLTRKFGEIYDL